LNVKAFEYKFFVNRKPELVIHCRRDHAEE